MVCYSFAHGGAEKPVSLATVLRAWGAAQTKDVIEAIFDPGLQAWYEQRRTPDEDIGLYLSHRRPYFTSAQDLHRKGDAFRKIVQEVCKDAVVRTFRTASAFIVDIAGKQIDIRNLEQKIFSQDWGMRATECIGHGDLNAENIMVKPTGSDFAVLDFRDTGWHHTFRDFCSVEGSIRTLYPRAADAKDFLAYFRQEIDRQAQEARIFASMADGDARTRGIEDFQASIGDALQSDTAHRDLISVLRCLYHQNFMRRSSTSTRLRCSRIRGG